MSRLVYDTPSAVDAIYGIALQAIKGASVQAIAPITTVKFYGDEATVPDDSTYWCACSYQTVVEAQASLAGNVGFIGSKQYQSTGLLFVQVFCPKSDVKAVDNGLLIGSIIRDAFRKPVQDGSIWFRNHQLRQPVFNSKNYQYNVVITYEYQSIA
jgi:hypothetical protein